MFMMQFNYSLWFVNINMLKVEIKIFKYFNMCRMKSYTVKTKSILIGKSHENAL